MRAEANHVLVGIRDFLNTGGGVDKDAASGQQTILVGKVLDFLVPAEIKFSDHPVIVHDLHLFTGASASAHKLSPSLCSSVVVLVDYLTVQVVEEDRCLVLYLVSYPDRTVVQVFVSHGSVN